MSGKFDKDNLVIDKVISFYFYCDCPSCNERYELVKDESGMFVSPQTCPNCGFDLAKHKQADTLKRQKEIENNEYCQLRYDVMTADLVSGVKLHPQEQMIALGYKLLDSIPQTIADCWWFTVDRFIEPLPEYLHKIKYTIGQP